MTELLPCPFCGGEAEIRGDRALFVQCAKCGTRYGDSYHATEAEAIAAWNTRAGRVTVYPNGEQGITVCGKTYVPERACKPLGTIRHDYEGGYAGFEYETELSCGHKWRDAYGDYPEYCPSCGAKVIGG